MTCISSSNCPLERPPSLCSAFNGLHGALAFCLQKWINDRMQRSKPPGALPTWRTSDVIYATMLEGVPKKQEPRRLMKAWEDVLSEDLHRSVFLREEEEEEVSECL